MTMELSSKSRTLTAYATDLLQLPRWIIEREVDFTDCAHDGHFDESSAECVNCQFGRGCCWLDRKRTPSIHDATLDDLVTALEGAVEYFESARRLGKSYDAEMHDWMREARRFLRSHHG